MIMNGKVSLFVESRGGGSPVIFIHGFPETADTWDKVIGSLPEKAYGYIALDLRGFGRSAKPKNREDYTMDIFVSDIVALIKHFGDRAVLVGHDWGGLIAWETAHRHPELVAKLVVLDCPHPAYFPKALRTLGQIRKSWYVFLFQIPFLPEFVWKLFKKESMHYPLMYYRALPKYLRARQKRYGVLTMPALVLWATKDKYLANDFAKPPENIVPFCRVVYFDASHWLQLEKPKEVASEIETFLKENPPY